MGNREFQLYFQENGLFHYNSNILRFQIKKELKLNYLLVNKFSWHVLRVIIGSEFANGFKENNKIFIMEISSYAESKLSGGMFQASY